MRKPNNAPVTLEYDGASNVARMRDASRPRSWYACACALVCAIACACALLFAPQPALADQVYVIDNYHLFNSSEYAVLESHAEQLADEYKVGVYLLVVNNIGSSSARQYAIDYYRGNSLGLGQNKDGILFLIAVNSRDYVTITYGNGIYAFTDYQIEKMEDAIVSELRHDNWYDAAVTYYDKAEETLSFLAEHGEPLDYNNAPVDPFDRAMFLLIGIAVAAAIAGMRCAMLYSQMKTAKEAVQANRYLDRNSFVLLSHDDRYLTSSVVATPRVKASHSHGGSSIGSGGFGGSGGGKF